MEYYKRVLNRLSNRENKSQFFTGDANASDQYYTGRKEVSNQDFLGVVLDYTDGVMKIEQRNNFKVGDTIEVFGPNSCPTKIKVESITNEDNESVSAANHPQEELYVKVPFKVEKNDILGYLELETELNYLKTDKRKEVLNSLKEARALGDLSENAEYDSAREEQGKLEARIKEVEYILEHATIIDDAQTEKDKVTIGSTVSLQYDGDDEVEEYRIVGSQEADPFNNKISNESPIAMAILGKKVGQMAEVESPNGTYKVKIVKVA